MPTATATLFFFPFLDGGQSFSPSLATAKMARTAYGGKGEEEALERLPSSVPLPRRGEGGPKREPPSPSVVVLALSRYCCLPSSPPPPHTLVVHTHRLSRERERWPFLSLSLSFSLALAHRKEEGTTSSSSTSSTLLVPPLLSLSFPSLSGY